MSERQVQVSGMSAVALENAVLNDNLPISWVAPPNPTLRNSLPASNSSRSPLDRTISPIFCLRRSPCGGKGHTCTDV
jgi:hypothetical protein